MFRSATSNDTAQLVRLFRSADVTEIGQAETSVADIADLLRAPGLDLPTRSLVAVEDDQILGAALCHPAPQPGQLRVQLRVAPADTAERLARMLLTSVREWVLADKINADMPVTLFQLPRSLAAPALVAQGWTKVHRYTRMIADLASCPDLPRTEGVHVRPATSLEDMATVHRVLEAAISGHWNHKCRSFEDFLADQQQRDGHDPAMWLQAERDGLPVGAIIARGPLCRAWIAWLGVLPSARGCGIATTLLGSTFSLLRSRGHETVGVDVDTHNQTQAGAVYQRAGMREVGAADQWWKTFP
jgi:mycothiol synthase